MTAKPAFLDGICTVYDCLPQYLQGGCLLIAVICALIFFFNRNRWFR
ncbi:hypothetical protein [Lysobacter brunescens]|uniref:Uncharacterized protein n=1 Tax=Lysobacter brunescens TaxID=262323 RepID=A0ABW2YFP8_9GAMM